MKNDAINPAHYTSHPSGIECIQITEHMSFTLGNALKYIWRADMKGGVEDLEKAIWYLNREIAKRNIEHANEMTGKETKSKCIHEWMRRDCNNGKSMFMCRNCFDVMEGYDR